MQRHDLQINDLGDLATHPNYHPDDDAQQVAPPFYNPLACQGKEGIGRSIYLLNLQHQLKLSFHRHYTLKIGHPLEMFSFQHMLRFVPHDAGVIIKVAISFAGEYAFSSARTLRDADRSEDDQLLWAQEAIHLEDMYPGIGTFPFEPGACLQDSHTALNTRWRGLRAPGDRASLDLFECPFAPLPPAEEDA